MAMNPMQRRSRNSFLLGFLLAIIIGAIAVFFLYNMMDSIKKEKEAIEALQQTVYVAISDIQSGEEVTMDSFMKDTVQTTVDSGEFITDMDFEYINEKTGDIVERIDANGNKIEKKMVVKTNVPAGTIITKDMLEEIDDQTTSDQRLQEYNMIILPTMLEEGDYIDVRLKLPEGEDYIVISKKKVIRTTADTVWLKMSEDEILSLGNAIVEAYAMTGSKLYATTYTEAGRQEAATPTYPVSQAVLSLIEKDPNIVNDAKEGLYERYNDQGQVDQRNDHINSQLSDYYENMHEAVETGLQEEITKLQEAREEYVEALEGTGVVEAE